MIHQHRPPPKTQKQNLRDRSKKPPPFSSRGRAAGEAPGVLIKPMQQPIYKPPVWVAPIR